MQVSFFSVFCFLQDFSEGDGVGVLRRIVMSVVISLVVEFVGGLRLNLVRFTPTVLEALAGVKLIEAVAWAASCSVPCFLGVIHKLRNLKEGGGG